MNNEISVGLMVFEIVLLACVLSASRCDVFKGEAYQTCIMMGNAPAECAASLK